MKLLAGHMWPINKIMNEISKQQQNRHQDENKPVDTHKRAQLTTASVSVQLEFQKASSHQSENDFPLYIPPARITALLNSQVKWNPSEALLAPWPHFGGYTGTFTLLGSFWGHTGRQGTHKPRLCTKGTRVNTRPSPAPSCKFSSNSRTHW